MGTLTILLGGFFLLYVVLDMSAKMVRNVRIIRNKVTTWRGVEYRKAK